MGIGNRQRHGWKCGRWNLITPHGDRELSKLWPTLRWCSSSLPLMGIGNYGSTSPTAPCKHSLITPHGDRERKLATSPCSLFGVSLPLMGIGNLAGVRARCPQVELITPHGDREQEDGQGPHEAGGRSLPLMGIGNPAPFGVVLGDFNSLPLMGIGNVPEGRRQRRYRQPHYPSWGSGTWTSSPRTRLRRRAAHYPSWGSGTCDAPEFEALADGLITPHGDRELEAFGPRDAATRSHYPSWGSGT